MVTLQDRTVWKNIVGSRVASPHHFFHGITSICLIVRTEACTTETGYWQPSTDCMCARNKSSAIRSKSSCSLFGHKLLFPLCAIETTANIRA